MLRKMLCCLLCCIAIVCLTATSAFADGWYWYDDAPQNGSISFDFNTEEIHVAGGSVELRQVAFVNEEAKCLQFCEGWEDCGLSVQELLGDKAAERLFVYAEANGLPARTVGIDGEGKGKAEDLPMGVWLVSQIVPFEGCMAMRPALISIPLMDEDGQWIFDVKAMPKLEPLVPETTVPSTESPPPELPPTGQVNWPIPLLAVGGLFLILLGFCLRKDKRHETNS